MSFRSWRVPILITAIAAIIAVVAVFAGRAAATWYLEQKVIPKVAEKVGLRNWIGRCGGRLDEDDVASGRRTIESREGRGTLPSI